MSAELLVMANTWIVQALTAGTVITLVVLVLGAVYFMTNLPALVRRFWRSIT